MFTLLLRFLSLPECIFTQDKFSIDKLTCRNLPKSIVRSKLRSIQSHGNMEEMMRVGYAHMALAMQHEKTYNLVSEPSYPMFAWGLRVRLREGVVPNALTCKVSSLLTS